MKKHIIAVAVAAAFAAPVAMADTTLYGLANMSLDYIDAGTFNEGAKTAYDLAKIDANGVGTGGFDYDSTKKVYVPAPNGDGYYNKVTTYSPRGGTNFNVASGSSRIGIKGSEKISNDLSAVYQAEFGVDMADGSTALSNRNQYVGLSSKSFGTFVAGRHDTPMKLAIAKYDLFGDQIGDNGNIVGVAGGTSVGFNLRTPNTVAYMTPNLAGFNATLAYVADHDQSATLSSASNDDRNKNQAFSASAGYAFKKLFNVTAAYELHNAKFISNLGRGKEDAWMIGAGTEIAGFTIQGLYQQMKSFDAVDNKTNVYGLGAAYTFGKKHTVKGQWFQSDYDSAADKRNMFAVGYDFAMGKQTTLYAAYAYGDNGQATWGDGHGGKTAVGIETNGDASNTNAFSVGMKYKF